MIQTNNINLTHGDVAQKRTQIRRYFLQTYALYEELFTHIKEEKAFYQKSNPLRHPHIFYLGHTATFYVNKLTLANLLSTRIDAHLESMFAVGVDEMGWDDLNDTHYDWPTLKETKLYRERVKHAVLDIIEHAPLTLPIEKGDAFWVIMMGIEHERIHIETSSVLIRQTAIEFVQPLKSWHVCTTSSPAPDNELLFVPSGKVTQNMQEIESFYGWDNEYGKHHADIPSFKASKYLVSNEAFLAFVEDGGYQHDSYWQEEGRRWKRDCQVKYPHFWVPSPEGYRIRFLAQEVPFMPDHPVEVNYHEAHAYCQWLSKKEGKVLRLPTEDEWYRLVDFCEVKDARFSKKSKANINLEQTASTQPITTFQHKIFYDIIGNVWQWTQTAIYPYEGFTVDPLYDDFSTPTFDTKHHLIKGGSWISTGNEALLSARYAFRKHFHQHAGFRYVQSDYTETVGDNIYESDELVSQYIEFGWGEASLSIPNYPATCAHYALEYMRDKPKTKALDIGCAIGRSSFELAREFDAVTGLDFTARFISTAIQMQKEGALHYAHCIEGDIQAFESVSLEDFNLSEVADKVTFWQADACNLKPLFNAYDLIFAGNLIDRLYDPKKFLEDVAHRLNDGGLLILTSPYTWLEAFTPKSKWIGGYIEDAKAIETLEGLKNILAKDFHFIEVKDIPFVIKETARKYQHTIAQMSVW
jgi:5-histidylcysteine sulfoxide synthase/putative 4-mercaptohistidine N1-methyltranferase